MINVGIIFIVLALVAYTTAVWTEKFTKELKWWIVIIFLLGFTFDTIGTSIMYNVAETKFAISFHSVCGYLALFIMLVHLIWAFLAINKVAVFEELFKKFSIYAWCLWLLAFISGLLDDLITFSRQDIVYFFLSLF